MKLKYAVLPATDIDRAIAFYTGTLRLTLVPNMLAGVAGRRAELAFPTGDASLLLEQGAGVVAADRPCMVLGVPDVDATFERLDALGVSFVTLPADAGPDLSSRCATFRDSEGNLVRIESA